eukprot:jgi/Psemu1/35466/gm1.35466_g
MTKPIVTIRTLQIIPYAIALRRFIQTIPSHHPYLILCDSGSKTTWFSHHILPESIIPTVTIPISGVTMAGEFNSTQQISLQHFTLLELDPGVTLPSLDACIFTTPCRYDIILKCNVL